MPITQTAGPVFAGHPLLHGLARNWWLILLRGIAAVVLGVLAFVWPAITFVTLLLLFGIYALADGVLALAAAIMGTSPTPSWWLAIVGVAGLTAGVLTFLRPDIASVALLIVIAAWAFVSGLMQIIGAIELRKEIDNEWLLIISGIFSIIFAAILLIQPVLGTLALIFSLGCFAIGYGILLIAFAFRLKRHTSATA